MAKIALVSFDPLSETFQTVTAHLKGWVTQTDRLNLSNKKFSARSLLTFDTYKAETRPQQTGFAPSARCCAFIDGSRTGRALGRALFLCGVASLASVEHHRL
jgi:hypothetical protein